MQITAILVPVVLFITLKLYVIFLLLSEYNKLGSELL